MATAAPPPPVKRRRNWFDALRRMTLIHDESTQIVRNIFDDRRPIGPLDVFLAKERDTINQLRNEKTITQSQYDLLFPQTGSPKTADFDFTLTLHLLRNLKSLGFNPNFSWYALPPEDLSLEADLCRLQLYRHGLSTISEQDCKDKWIDIKNILCRRNASLQNPDPNLLKRIHEYIEKHLAPETQKKMEMGLEGHIEEERQRIYEMQTRVAVGCDSGFGLALVKKLDSLGMKVFAGCLDKDGTGAAAIRHNCSNRVHILQLDVTNEKEISEAVDMVTLQVGEQGLWGLVNNAGIWYFSDIEMMSLPIIKKIIDVNLFGAIRMTKSLLPLIRQAKGRIVNVSSTLGRISMEGNGAYGISKHGLVAFSDTLRQEMKKWNVKVSIIEPTGYSTNSNNPDNLMRQRREEIWDSLDEEGRKTYGREYLDEVYNNLFDTFHRFPDDLTPVIRAMRSGLLSKRPRERYPCGAGADIITFIYNLVPVWLADKMSSSFGLVPKNAKPSALKNE